MTDTRSSDVEIRYIDVSGRRVTTTPCRVDGADMVRGRPVRAFPTHPGQQNYPGWLWTATTGSLIGYESLLERDRLWLADFDRQVRWTPSPTTQHPHAPHRPPDEGRRPLDRPSGIFDDE